jgi:hypothetical protein
LDRAFLSRKSEAYKHQVVGYSSCSWLPRHGEGGGGGENCTTDLSSFPSFRYNFPKLREILECGRRLRRSSGLGSGKESRGQDNKGEELDEGTSQPCQSQDWRNEAAQEIASLIRSLDAAAATLQSPLLPEESDTSN